MIHRVTVLPVILGLVLYGMYQFKSGLIQITLCQPGQNARRLPTELSGGILSPMNTLASIQELAGQYAT